MTVPMCPVHHVPMKVSQFGGFYCTQSDPNGKNGRCDYKVKGQAVPQPVAVMPASGPPVAMQAPYIPSQPIPISAPPSADLLAAAALLTAGMLCKGAGPEFEAQVVTSAQRMFAAMRAML